MGWIELGMRGSITALGHLLGVGLLLVARSNAQIGTTTCLCSPSNYQMTFDFTKNCESTALRGDGVVTSDCAVAPFQDDTVTDLVPVSVGSIDILELDENLTLLSQSSKFGTYQDGDTFDYESVSNTPTSVNATSYPRALQVSVIGTNAAGETLFFAGLMVFVTDCSVYPNLLEGSSIGWVQFTSLTDPNAAVCPLVDASLPVPDVVPTSASNSQSQKSPTPAPQSSSKAPVARPRMPSYAPVVHSADDDDDDDCDSGKGKKKKSEKKSKGKGHNVFNHECHSKKTDKKHKHDKGSSGKKKKGKGKGGKGYSESSDSLTYDDILDLLHSHPIPPTRGPIEAPSTMHPTVSSVRVPSSSSDAASSADDRPASSSSADDYSMSDQKEEIAHNSRSFWGSGAYYAVLCSSVILALFGACLMCYQPRIRRILDLEEEDIQKRAMLKNDDETWMTE